VVQNFLTSCENRFNGEQDRSIRREFSDKLSSVRLTFRKRMVIADPDQIGGARFLENSVCCRNGLEGLELVIELLDVLPAW
jgi:hypothetical protein